MVETVPAPSADQRTSFPANLFRLDADYIIEKWHAISSQLWETSWTFHPIQPSTSVSA